MAERKRSNDGRRETEEVHGAEGIISHGGASGGDLARKIGTRDEEKRTVSRPAGATRVEGSDKRKEGIDDNSTGGGV